VGLTSGISLCVGSLLISAAGFCSLIVGFCSEEGSAVFASSPVCSVLNRTVSFFSWANGFAVKDGRLVGGVAGLLQLPLRQFPI
jgi:hypothetical protein